MQQERRQFLRGAGTVLALPMLEASTLGLSASGARKGADKPVGRMVMIFNPHGPLNESWFPKTQGRAYQLSSTLAPLDRHRAQLSVVSGLCHPHFPNGAGHAIASRMLVGANGSESINGNTASPITSISMDQAVANTVGQATRFPSLQISSQAGTGLPGRSITLSFNATGVPLPSLRDPRQVFNRLFVPENAKSKALAAERHRQRTSVLDTVADQLKSLSGELGKDDRARLEDYQTSIRQIEKQLQRDYQWSGKKKPKVSAQDINFKPKTRTQWIETMNDITVLALQSDSTRVITMLNGVEVDGYNWHECDINMAHHALQHHNADPKRMTNLAKVDTHKISILARFCDRLKSVNVPGGNLLDQTMIWYGHGMNNGSGFKNGRGVHGTFDQAHLVVGGSKLGLKHGAHHRYPSKTPLSSLWITMMQRMGLEVDSFMDASSPLNGLT